MSRGLSSPGTLVLALAIPLIFLHEKFLPGFSVGSAHANLADLAVLAVAAAALAAGLTQGFEPLRRGRALWLAGGLLLALIFASTLWGHLRDGRYPTGTHLITAAKFAEYALLAPALPLLLRARSQTEVLLGAVTAWSCIATFVALLQFFGAIDDPFRHERLPGVRAQSFLGVHSFATLSCASLALALGAIVVPGLLDRRWAIAAGVAGGVGLTLSAAIAGVLGSILAALAAALVAHRRGLLTPRRALGLAGVIGAILIGSVLLRGHELSQVLKFLGIKAGASKTTLAGSSYTQRAVLAYVGGRIFLDHPVLGVGWQGSNDVDVFTPYVADAKRRFPDAPGLDFPSPQHRWGVQEAYLQAGSDMGAVGIVVFLGLFVVAALVAGRAAFAAGGLAMVPLLWILMAFGIWNGLSLVAGIPLAAFTWLGIGLAAAGYDRPSEARVRSGRPGMILPPSTDPPAA